MPSSAVIKTGGGAGGNFLGVYATDNVPVGVVGVGGGFFLVLGQGQHACAPEVKV